MLLSSEFVIYYVLQVFQKEKRFSKTVNKHVIIFLLVWEKHDYTFVTICSVRIQRTSNIANLDIFQFSIFKKKNFHLPIS